MRSVVSVSGVKVSGASVSFTGVRMRGVRVSYVHLSGAVTPIPTSKTISNCFPHHLKTIQRSIRTDKGQKTNLATQAAHADYVGTGVQNHHWLCHLVSCRVASYSRMSCHVMLRHLVSRRVMCLAVSRRAVLCHRVVSSDGRGPTTLVVEVFFACPTLRPNAIPSKARFWSCEHTQSDAQGSVSVPAHWKCCMDDVCDPKNPWWKSHAQRLVGRLHSVLHAKCLFVWRAGLRLMAMPGHNLLKFLA